MTCDYVLSTGDNILCVELAGMLRSKKYCDSFLNNCEIEDSETLENYRVSLNRKSELLKENDINHMILLLWDFNEEMFDRIIKGFYGLNNTI